MSVYYNAAGPFTESDGETSSDGGCSAGGWPSGTRLTGPSSLLALAEHDHVFSSCTSGGHERYEPRTGPAQRAAYLAYLAHLAFLAHFLRRVP